ncbi:hypothetical protein evm_003700 [Chilo suppressalis]|nr:hypothetical protein evm_003700 [Chilo suppressalis]
MPDASTHLHVFPNPEKDWDRFNTWILSIGGDIVNLSNDFIYKYRRVCHAHFEDKYHCHSNRLSNAAVPSLNVPGLLSIPKYSLVGPPLRQRQNLPENVTSSSKDCTEQITEVSLFEEVQNLIGNIPSTSKGYIQEMTTLCTPADNQDLMKENIANIAYNERKDKVIGFVDNGEHIKPEYADHAQVFMIRGLTKNYKQPISYSFSAAATNGPELCKQIKSIVQELQRTGLIVVATVCDQSTNNRQAIKLLVNEYHSACLRKGTEAKNNVFTINDQIIVPLYDTPHMLKCVRNNLLTKNLVYKEKENKTAKWEHLELLLKENPGYRGMRLIPKLTDCHIVPQRIPKMKVKYASQVFSQTVANNMGYLADKGILPEACRDTADLLLFFDKLFDSVNGSYKKNIHSKPLLGPVKEKSIHHKVWNDAKSIIKTMKFVNKDTGKVESVPTLTNWVWTLDNIQVLLTKLKSDYGVTSVWMRHLNQDPIENYFGAVRSHGCRNINPTAEKFESAFTTLLLNNMSSVHALGANCEKDYCDNLHALIITNSDKTMTTCDLTNIPDIDLLDLEEKKDPRILGPLQYVSGYFIKQSKAKIFRNCEK